MSKLVPKYSLAEAVAVAIRLGAKALEEVRALKREPGPAGQDGMGFDDFSMEYDGEKTFTFVFKSGDREKRYDFLTPIILDRGVFKEGQSYVRGDCVTFGGCAWVAQTEAKSRPGTDSTWRLFVKKGRDAKDPVSILPPKKEG